MPLLCKRSQSFFLQLCLFLLIGMALCFWIPTIQAKTRDTSEMMQSDRSHGAKAKQADSESSSHASVFHPGEAGDYMHPKEGASATASTSMVSNLHETLSSIYRSSSTFFHTVSQNIDHKLLQGMGLPLKVKIPFRKINKSLA